MLRLVSEPEKASSGDGELDRHRERICRGGEQHARVDQVAGAAIGGVAVQVEVGRPVQGHGRHGGRAGAANELPPARLICAVMLLTVAVMLPPKPSVAARFVPSTAIQYRLSVPLEGFGAVM